MPVLFQSIKPTVLFKHTNQTVQLKKKNLNAVYIQYISLPHYYYTFQCISHHLQGELKFFLLKAIYFHKADCLSKYVLNWSRHKIYNSVGLQYFYND
jgi:hypothetical protein